MENVTRVRRTKRRLRREIKYGLIGLAVILVLVLILTVFIPAVKRKNLRELGYSKEAITQITEQKLTKTLLNREYSAALDENLRNGVVIGKELELYSVCTNVNDDLLYLRGILTKKGYSNEDFLKIAEKLKYSEMTPLLVFNDVQNMDEYIEDVIKNRSVNGVLVGNPDKYTNYYEDMHDVEDDAALDVLVNKYSMVSEDYVPEMVTMSVVYASKGVQMREDAYEAFKEMVSAMKDQGLGGIYASNAYRSAESQKSLYNRYANTYGQEWADAYSARPGSSEHQLGLTCDVVATKNVSAAFADTDEYLWMIANSYKYGWILRYPEGKEGITGYSFESWHYRYLGVELATAVYKSGLTYDEYYELYLRNYE